MMRNKITQKILYILLFTVSFAVMAQESSLDISNMTKEDVMELSYDQLLELPLEDLMALADIVGVSLDELYEMILNKDVVSASKKVESSFEAPLSTSVVSYEEIKRSGARNVEEALRLVPGLIVREKTSSNFDVHMRGNDNVPPNHMFLYSENSISLVMINGRPVYNYAHGGTFWETLPVGLEDIDRIEVVRGPSSALYGPNAVSGVVNIITKDLNQEEKTKFNVEGGTQGNLISSLRLQKRFKNDLGMAITGNWYQANRNTDEMYVYKLDEYITIDELAEAKDPDNPGYLIFDTTDNVDDMWPNPKKARESKAVNVYLDYELSEKSRADFVGGVQHSEVISSTMGDNPTPTVGRESITGYGDFRLKLDKLSFQANYSGGWQDIVRQDTGFKIQIQNVNGNAEYDLNVGGLNIRPGIAYQAAFVNDMPYLRYRGQGFFNGPRDIMSFAASVRFDYTLFDNLRLIAALRGEDYNTHDDIYLSYQFVASYKINDKHLVRAVHSRANRGPFLVDTYANYLWDREGRPIPRYIDFQGEKNLDLLTMDMYEFGYRVKPVKSVQADIEGFYTIADNYSALYPDSVNINGGLPYARMKYTNIETVSKQTGLTATISWVANQDLVFKAFGTWQKTQLNDIIDYLHDQTIELMLVNANFSPDKSSVNFPKSDDNENDITNEWTPSFYGGFIANYNFNDKLNVNLNTYYYSEQKFASKYADYDNENDEIIPVTIDPKIIINAKVGYNINEHLNVFANIRNPFMNQREFGYLDKIGGLYMLGLSLKY